MNPFRQFTASILPLLNQLWNKVEGLTSMRGDNFISVKRVGNGTVLGLNIEAVRKRLIKSPGGGGSGGVRRARVLEDAGPSVGILVNLFDDAGEIFFGPESNVSVICEVSGGTNLDNAIPRLEIGDIIFVAFFTPFWRCVTVFQSTQDCTCGS